MEHANTCALVSIGTLAPGDKYVFASGAMPVGSRARVAARLLRLSSWGCSRQKNSEKQQLG